VIWYSKRISDLCLPQFHNMMISYDKPAAVHLFFDIRISLEHAYEYIIIMVRCMADGCWLIVKLLDLACMYNNNNNNIRPATS
jgi:hypothetical protein